MGGANASGGGSATGGNGGVEGAFFGMLKSIFHRGKNSLSDGAFFGGGQSTSLKTTGQGYQKITLNGKELNVYDHPNVNNPQRIGNQGSAFPDDGKGNGITGTCGLCACGTIINKAGGNANEKKMITFATQNDLCGNKASDPPDGRGGTSNLGRVEILNRAGIPTSDRSGTKIEDLAKEVENGHGVIIAVDAGCFYNEPDYLGAGHAIVLDSVARDAKTGNIVGYYVVDSNNPTGVSQYIDANKLREAYEDRGQFSLVTDNIIW